MSDTEAVLVTGGAGYIGSTTAKLLKSKGLVPVVIDNLHRGHQDFVKYGPFVIADLKQTDVVESVLREYQIKKVLHFAALAYVGESVQKPLDYFDNNVGGTLSLVRAMKAAGVRDLVFSSTCSTYGIPAADGPISEETPQNPMNPYGQSKWICEKLLAFSGLRVVALRYFNAAGTESDLEVGERHNPESHLIPATVIKTLRKQPVEIFGNDYPTEDGTCIRDYIHVEDLAEAHWLSLHFLDSMSKSFQAFNLGTGVGSSVKEVVECVFQELGFRGEIKNLARRPGDPPRLVARADRARTELKWNPHRSTLQHCVSSAIAWFKKEESRM